jgi:hypothetical protein
LADALQASKYHVNQEYRAGNREGAGHKGIHGEQVQVRDERNGS